MSKHINTYFALALVALSFASAASLVMAAAGGSETLSQVEQEYFNRQTSFVRPSSQNSWRKLLNRHNSTYSRWKGYQEK